MLALCLLAVAIVGCSAQSHNLHSICHSNHQQMIEDQVIEMVVAHMDANHDGTVVEAELLIFFADLMGALHGLPSLDVDVLQTLDTALLLQLGADLQITRHDFVQAWHTRYHDSVEFISATFDALDNFDGHIDGVMDASDIEDILDHAMVNFDTNHDNALQQGELVAYLEHIYKNC